jgi:hypothetical protein
VSEGGKKRKCILPNGHGGPHRSLKDTKAKRVDIESLSKDALLELLVRVADVIDDAIFTDLDVAQGVLDDIGKALADIEDKRAWLRAKWGD